MIDTIVSVLAVVGALVIAFLIYVAMKPSEFRIERALAMQASPEAIFPLINDLRQFNSWNPFAKSDPEVNITYSGPANGIGAAYDWNGRKSGAGRMRIAEVVPSSKVRMQLDFNKPFVANNVAEFTLAPRGTLTTVTWAMTGRSPFSHKLMGTLFNMDKMVGGEFAKGLASLKAMVEKSAA
jgi:hypothetical protein